MRSFHANQKLKLVNLTGHARQHSQLFCNLFIDLFGLLAYGWMTVPISCYESKVLDRYKAGQCRYVRR